MVYRAGIDAGTETVKAVILGEAGEMGWAVIATGNENPDTTAQKALSQASEKFSLPLKSIDCITVTGTNAESIIFAPRRLTEVVCLARGINYLIPSARTLVDIGALKTLGLRCSEGNLQKYVSSSKCAVGTGTFLAAAADVLGISVSKMDEMAFRAKNDVDIESTCTVFAESEIISLIHRRVEPEDIARGVFRGLAKRVYSLLIQLGIERELVLAGGLARCKSIISALEESAGFKILAPETPEIVSALGAALFPVLVMITAGIDIGSASAKAVLMEDGKVIGNGIIRTGNRSIETAHEVMEKALSARRLSLKDVNFVVSTGYGRVNVPFAQKSYSEIICHGRGIASLFPNVRTLLDIGGQDCKVIRVNEQGKVENFVMNDKCAAGTGRYLERVSKVIGVPLEELGQRSLQSAGNPTPISSYCAVFAQRDVYSLFRQGKSINDISAGICEALVEMLLVLIKKLRLVKDFAVSGGVAKNGGIIMRLERDLDVKACVAPEPQLTGALGAAILAQEILKKGS